MTILDPFRGTGAVEIFASHFWAAAGAAGTPVPILTALLGSVVVALAVVWLWAEQDLRTTTAGLSQAEAELARYRVATMHLAPDADLLDEPAATPVGDAAEVWLHSLEDR